MEVAFFRPIPKGEFGVVFGHRPDGDLAPKVAIRPMLFSPYDRTVMWGRTMRRSGWIVGVLGLCAASFAAGYFVKTGALVSPFGAGPHPKIVATSAPSPVGDENREHLEPLNAIDFSMEDILRGAFAEAYGANVRARVYSWGFGVHRMLYVADRTDHFDLVVLRTWTDLHQYSKAYHFVGEKPPIPADYRAIRPDRCATSIPTATGRKIVEAWHQTLLETRYAKRPLIGSVDGYSIYSMEIHANGRSTPMQGVTAVSAGEAMETLIWAMNALCKVDKAPSGAVEYGITRDQFIDLVNHYPNIKLQ